MSRPPQPWDIFCAVVDNYGDAGICWRLARALVAEHGVRVRLFIDAPAALSRIAPAVDATLDAQQVENVEIRAWGSSQPDPQPVEPGSVVIEAFGCGLPSWYLAAMTARVRPPVWINLEYLSAEKWIEDCHGLASLQPALPLTRYFFFPGFTQASGGLLRENDLLSRRDRFRADPEARASLWRGLGLPAPAPATLAVSMFCYPSAALAELLDVWSGGDPAILCVIPEGIATAALERWSDGAAPRVGEHRVRGRLTLAVVPFVAQDEYDRLLWACDFNFVRGEDSFVRAQWAAQPFIWHIYPQAENAHRLKLDAFLERYCAGLRSPAAAALRVFARAWNGDGRVADAWPPLARELDALGARAKTWAAERAAQPDLATALVRFCRDRV
jgi:uncharacterized repeat protein (TIGR03837 family)